MTEIRVRMRNTLEAGDTGDGRSNVPMDVAMEMATAVTSITVETEGTIIVELMQKK